MGRITNLFTLVLQQKRDTYNLKLLIFIILHLLTSLVFGQTYLRCGLTFNNPYDWKQLSTKNAGRSSHHRLPRPRHLLLCVWKRHGELRFLKCCVGYVLQFMDRLLCQRTHRKSPQSFCGSRLVVNADGWLNTFFYFWCGNTLLMCNRFKHLFCITFFDTKYLTTIFLTKLFPFGNTPKTWTEKDANVYTILITN